MINKVDLKQLIDAFATLAKHSGSDDEEAKAELEAAGKTINRLVSGFGDSNTVYLRDNDAEMVIDTIKDQVAFIISKDKRDIIIKIDTETARSFASGLVLMAEYAENYDGKPRNFFQENKILGMSQFFRPMEIEEFFPLTMDDASELFHNLPDCELRDRLEDFLSDWDEGEDE